MGVGAGGGHSPVLKAWPEGKAFMGQIMRLRFKQLLIYLFSFFFFFFMYLLCQS